MSKVLKLLLWTLTITGVLVLVFVTCIIIFVNSAPQIGAPPTGTYLETVRTSPQYQDDQFVNTTRVNTEFSIIKGLQITYDILTAEGTEPQSPVPTRFAENVWSDDTLTRLTWYGHSAFLLEMEGKRILVDPMLGPSAAPVSFFGKRFEYEQAIPIDELQNIDIVVLSHDHYDHLDYFTIMKLQSEVNHFFAPLGVGSHLRSWGIPEYQISELDWWDEAEFLGIRLVATPARHFSGRGLDDRQKTLWASWVITGQYTNIYFSGDGGYDTHFSEIGTKYGPFDLAMMECGQYNQQWADIHMMPEETFQAGLDVRARALMPVHWGAFSLALHPWKDPVNRLYAAANDRDISLISPFVGQPFIVGSEFPDERWWEEME